MKPWLAVVGIGEDGIAGLTPAARALIETAEVLVGGARHLGMVPDRGAERILWERPLSLTIDAIAARRGGRVTVLASGDPMWYGIGATLSGRFPREEMTIVPQPSAFSLAAARLGWPLADCTTITLHGRPFDTLRLQLAPQRRILILSDDGNTPRIVAELLTRLGWGPSQLTVLARLGAHDDALEAVGQPRFWLAEYERHHLGAFEPPSAHEADEVLDSLDDEALMTRRTIQNYDVTVLEAVYHVVEHFGMHTGQIILLSKARIAEDLSLWTQPEPPGAPKSTWFQHISKGVAVIASTGAALISIITALFSYGVIGSSESHQSIGNLGAAWVKLRPAIDTASAIGDTIHFAATGTKRAPLAPTSCSCCRR